MGDALTLDAAAATTRTGDIWLFRGHKTADRTVRMRTNRPVNPVAMAVTIGDLPPLLWHTEPGGPCLMCGREPTTVGLNSIVSRMQLECGRIAMDHRLGSARSASRRLR